MAPQQPRRDQWYKVGGRWTQRLEVCGCSVRLFQKRRNGTFYRKVWITGEGYSQASLKTKDRDEAERRGKALLAALLEEEPLPRSGVVTLQELWDRFSEEAPMFLDNAETTRQDARSRANILLGFFGPNCDVSKLTEHDVRAYEAKRKAGGIVRPDGKKTAPARASSHWSDLVLLRSMLRWATTVRVDSGQRWLKEDPLRGIPLVKEAHPLRPVASWDRYKATREAMQLLASQAKSESKRRLWLMMELALLLAEATGRRLGSIRSLRWEDIDFERNKIRWRGEFDKKRCESNIPIPDDLAAELKDFRRKLGAIAGWVFPRESDGEKPMDRHLFDKWLVVAEKKAKLPKLKGGLWHPYRRMWATTRKDYPIKDVAAAGGWSDTETLLTCYQQPDDETLQEVMSCPKKLRERVSQG